MIFIYLLAVKETFHLILSNKRVSSGALPCRRMIATLAANGINWQVKKTNEDAKAIWTMFTVLLVLLSF